MHKNELAASLADKVDLPVNKSTEVVAAVFGIITDALTEGEEVVITDFGKFSITKTTARTGRNPKTGEAVKIPAKYAVKFKPGKGLKDSVNR